MKKFVCGILAILLTVSLAACQSASKPEDAVKGYFEAAKASDTVKANTFVNSKNVSSEGSSSGTSSGDKEETDLLNNITDYLKSNNEKVTYNIKNEEVKDNSAIITVDCKFVDASAILKDTMADYITQAFAKAFTSSQSSDDSAKEISKLFNNKAKTAKETFIEKTIKVHCVKINDKWYVDKEDDDLKNAFSSNLVSAGNEISKSFNSKNASGSGSSSSGASQAESVKDKLSEINDYIVSDIWNKGLCDINSYLAEGKGSTGESLDIDFTLQQLDDAMKKKPNYDSFISKLDDSKYSKIKSIWSKLSAETDSLYKAIKLKKPAPNSGKSLDTGKFEQYRDAFSNEVENIKD